LHKNQRIIEEAIKFNTINSGGNSDNSLNPTKPKEPAKQPTIPDKKCICIFKEAHLINSLKEKIAALTLELEAKCNHIEHIKQSLKYTRYIQKDKEFKEAKDQLIQKEEIQEKLNYRLNEKLKEVKQLEAKHDKLNKENLHYEKEHIYLFDKLKKTEEDNINLIKTNESLQFSLKYRKRKQPCNISNSVCNINFSTNTNLGHLLKTDTALNLKANTKLTTTTTKPKPF